MSQVGALLGIASFAITYISTGAAVVALGVAGLFYIFVGFPMGVYSLVLDEDRPKLVKTASVILLVAALGIILWSFIEKPPDLNQFGVLQWWGCIALIGLVPGVILWLYITRPSTKTCPDCMETVHGDARVCKFCAFRWQPRPTLSDES